MSAAFDAARAARQILDARRTLAPIAMADLAGAPSSLAEVYAVQQAVMTGLGAVGGFKTGRPGPGETPVFAPIPAAGVRASPARFDGGELRLAGIELEVAFLVEKPLPPVDSADFAERARACVVPVVAIEVVDTRLADHEAAGAFWKLSDNQLNTGLVVGQPVRDWHRLDLENVTISLIAGAKSLASGAAKTPGGNAFDVFCAFAAAVGTHCGGLQVGHYVTTGSTMGLVFVEKGCVVRGEIAGLGRVEVEIGG